MIKTTNSSINSREAKMETQYEITNGYAGSMGCTWERVNDITADEALTQAAAFEKIDRPKLETLLNDGRGAAAKTGKQSPNYYYDHGMEKIRAVAAPTPKNTKKIYTCKSCGNTGTGRSYPFSTCPDSGLCDDCV